MGISSSKNLKNKIMSEYVHSNYNCDSVNSRTPMIDLLNSGEESQVMNNQRRNLISTCSFNENFECQFCYEIMVDEQLAKLWCNHFSCYDCYVQIRNSKQIAEKSKICGICQRPLKLEIEYLDELDTRAPSPKYQKLNVLDTPFRKPLDYNPIYNQHLSPYYEELILSLNGLNLEDLNVIDNHTFETLENRITQIDQNYPKLMILDYNREHSILTIICIPSIRDGRIFTYKNIVIANPSDSYFAVFHRQYVDIDILGFKTFYNNINTYRFLNNNEFTLELNETNV